MKIKKLFLHTKHFDEQREFFTQTMGFSLIESSEKFFTLKVGRTELTFSKEAESWQGSYHFAFNIPMNQIKEARAWLEARTPLIKNAEGNPLVYSVNWDADIFYFYDKAGNVLEFIARTDLDNASQEPFTTDSIECVSETSVVASTASEAIHALESEFGVSVYKNSDGGDFAALGDAEGLFIVVSDGRAWAPDYKLIAQKTKSKVVFEVNGKEFIFETPY
jgi:catechol 2,3-dioxygenase-like lactoylglutathione lyase family enzyme